MAGNDKQKTGQGGQGKNQEANKRMQGSSQGARQGDQPGSKQSSGQGGNRSGGSQGETGGRGFASMDPNKQREIASEGGRAAHAAGTAHEFTSQEAREAGRMSHKNDGNEQSGQGKGNQGGQANKK